MHSLEELEQRFMEGVSEDAKEHRRLEKEYQKTVRNIEARYARKIISEDHLAFIEAVRNEYKSNRRMHAEKRFVAEVSAAEKSVDE